MHVSFEPGLDNTIEPDCTLFHKPTKTTLRVTCIEKSETKTCSTPGCGDKYAPIYHLYVLRITDATSLELNMEEAPTSINLILKSLSHILKNQTAFCKTCGEHNPHIDIILQSQHFERE